MLTESEDGADAPYPPVITMLTPKDATKRPEGHEITGTIKGSNAHLEYSIVIRELSYKMKDNDSPVRIPRFRDLGLSAPAEFDAGALPR